MVKQRKKAENRGRKPLPDGEKKVTIILYVREKDILNAGGYRPAKEKAINAILGL